MVVGDSGWCLTHTRGNNKMLTFWNKLVNIDDSRHIKSIPHEGKNLWYKDIKSVFAKCNMLQLFNSKQTVPNLKSTLEEQYLVKR